ncbi:SpoIIE family protein phosphatase [Balneolaceae bacterium ANBcel3]|nr:SpoIIE family protein phosphatase [Balneolaceae bacterium ANBcel3]
MALDNETRERFGTRAFYREYTRGMTPDRINREFQNDSRRLKELYNDAIGVSRNDPEEHKKPIKIFQLLSSLLLRLTPARRLVFGLSVVGMLLYLIGQGTISTLLLPLSFLGIICVLFLELLEKSDVKQEIDLARDIQISLLPSSDLKFHPYEFASFASTASDVGGDYVDVISSPEGTYYIIADVSGKGLSASLYMVRLQALAHLIIKKLTPDPKELLTYLNDFIKSGKKDKTFVTACAAFFPNDPSRPVTMCRAGHNPPILYQSKKETFCELRSNGLGLGMTGSTIFTKQLQLLNISMEAGDNLIFYTDGLTEARNKHKEQFEEYRLHKIIELYGSLNATSIRQKIHVALEDFIGSERLSDDITYTCIHKHA